MPLEFKLEESDFRSPGPGEMLYTCTILGQMISGEARIGLSIEIPFGTARKKYVITHLQTSDDEGEWAKAQQVSGLGKFKLNVKIPKNDYEIFKDTPPDAGSVIKSVSPL